MTSCPRHPARTVLLLGWVAASALPVVPAQRRPARAAEVPPPSETPAELVVSGRTSTAGEITVVKVGRNVPATFTRRTLTNTPGFEWYVSRHYALKTDYKEAKARSYLTLLEMAYPHYAELFGREPEGIETRRMAVVYASSKQQLDRALRSDGIRWNFDGGGITFEEYRCAYQYPSGTLQYHQRYILLHECTHLFQMSLVGSTYTTPAWYFEGIADALANHVYQEQARRATFGVLDKPTAHNYLDQGLREMAKTPRTFRRLHDAAETSRGVRFLMAQFFLTDPDRCQRLRIWRDEMFRLAVSGERRRVESARLLEALFGSWDKINADFRAWVAARHSTFHYAEWGWEQDGDTLWSYGFAPQGRLSQTDVNLPPGGEPTYDPLRMDYPAQPPSPLVGPVRRGGDEPSVGCLVDFSRCPGRGCAGMGLGVGPGRRQQYVQVLVVRERELSIQGAELGLPKKAAAIPKALQAAAAAGGHQLGLTARIAAKALEVTLRAADPKAAEPVELEVSVPIDAAQRKALLSRPGAVLSRDGWHGVTPYFDDRRRPEPDLAVPAPANRWRNSGGRQLGALYRARWHLRDRAPESLVRLEAEMLAAAPGPPERQAAAMAAFRTQIPRVLADVRASGASGEAVAAAAAGLTAVAPPLGE